MYSKFSTVYYSFILNKRVFIRHLLLISSILKTVFKLSCFLNQGNAWQNLIMELTLKFIICKEYVYNKYISDDRLLNIHTKIFVTLERGNFISNSLMTTLLIRTQTNLNATMQCLGISSLLGTGDTFAKMSGCLVVFSPLQKKDLIMIL